ncbi:MAG: glycosyltransferase family 4 protein [Kiritimatiellia bacterium]
MKIGLMLRTIEEKQGIGIYTRNLVEELLQQDSENEYVLFYRSPDFMGTFSHFPRVTERCLPAGNKLVWDQIKIPLAARKEKIDLLFHTKFTVPFLTRIPCVMSIHGASWFVHPELYAKADVVYIKTVMPLYCRKAAYIVSNSDLTTNDYKRILKVPDNKIRTIRLGRNERFKPVTDPDQLAQARITYRLPEKFIFSVVKYDPRKNFENLIKGFQLLRQKTDCKLVVAGIGCEKYREEYQLDKDGTADDVTFLGWVEQEDLPAIYSLAHCMLFPSVYEEFGIPTCEAMACGCPPVVSRTGALPEISGEAGTLVDPFDPEDIADKLYQIWTDEPFRKAKIEKSLQQAEHFTWKRCAGETLEVLRQFQD